MAPQARRQFLQSAAAVGLLGLAGCAGLTGTAADLAANRVPIDGPTHARYNALVARFGWVYGLKPNDGVTEINPQDGSAVLDKPHLYYLGMMQFFADNPANAPKQ